MMKITLIADVHGNLPALEAVLQDARDKGAAGMVLNLGDLTGYGPYPEEVVRWSRSPQVISILGDYDKKVLSKKQRKTGWARVKTAHKREMFAWTYQALSKPSRKFLRSLPESRQIIVEGVKITLSHGSPIRHKEYIGIDTPREHLQHLVAHTDSSVLLFGHTHRAFVRQVGDALFINPGTVGRPDDGDSRASYAILEIEHGGVTVNHYRVPYNVSETVSALRRAGLPEVFTQVFRKGLNYDDVIARQNFAPGEEAHISSGQVNTQTVYGVEPPNNSNPHLLIIGDAPLHQSYPHNPSQVSVAGSGVYAALAALRGGCQVSLCSLKPASIPEAFVPLTNRLVDWLSPEELPDDLSVYDGVLITNWVQADPQYRCVETCIERGAQWLSTACSLNMVQESPHLVSTILERSDVTFFDAAGALAYFGALDQALTLPGKILMVLPRNAGVTVLEGDYRTDLPQMPETLLDATWAEDIFCGVAVAHLLGGAHPLIAARRAWVLACKAVEDVLPALLSDQDSPAIPLDSRVRIDARQVERIARMIGTIPEAKPDDFVRDYYPPVGHPAALDFFFVQTLQQFSFWETAQGRYSQPLISTIDGHLYKGSTYLSYAYLRLLDSDPGFYSPERQVSTDLEEILALFRADDGSDPMPAVELHLGMAQAYGKDMAYLGWTPQAIVERSNRSEKPLKTFLSILDHIGGYKEDLFRKKSNLLAMILKERPEKFLRISADEAIQPVIDYHVMRFCLRTGLVEVVDEALREKIAHRALVSVEDEWAIRYACYLTIQELIRRSGLSMGAVDNVAFNYNRSHCPEMTEPICAACALDPVCAHRKNLFQPVIRTTFY